MVCQHSGRETSPPWQLRELKPQRPGPGPANLFASHLRTALKTKGLSTLNDITRKAVSAYKTPSSCTASLQVFVRAPTLAGDKSFLKRLEQAGRRALPRKAPGRRRGRCRAMPSTTTRRQRSISRLFATTWGRAGSSRGHLGHAKGRQRATPGQGEPASSRARLPRFV